MRFTEIHLRDHQWLTRSRLRTLQGIHDGFGDSTSKGAWSGLGHWGRMYPPNVCFCGLNWYITTHKYFPGLGGSFSLKMPMASQKSWLLQNRTEQLQGVLCNAMRSECTQTQPALERVGHHQLFTPNPSGSRAPFPVAQLMSSSSGLLAFVFPTCSHILKPQAASLLARTQRLLAW